MENEFLTPIATLIIVKDLTKKTIETAIKYYVEEREGY